MFNRGKIAVMDPSLDRGVELYPKAEIPKRVVEFLTQKAYEELARSLDFWPAELVRADLLAFFEDAGIKVYDYDQVGAWLSMKKRQEKAEHWCWRPLRERDIITEYRWGINDGDDGYYSHKHWECRPYERLVPFPVLESVKNIEGRFGNHVKLFVSDYASSRPDPFIMVRPATCNSGLDKDYHFVFAHWDEPGFGI